MTVRIGVDVGGTKVRAAAVEVAGGDEAPRVVAQVVLPTLRGPDGVLATVGTAYERLLGEIVGHRPVVSVGVGIPGTVAGGTVSHAVNLGLDGTPFDLATALRPRLGSAPVVVENDVNAAAWGAAQWLRRHGGGDDLAVLNVGTGLAAGLVLDGVLRRGSRGMAGEVGHLVTDPAGPPCPCGKSGCLELYASGGGLARRWGGTAAQLLAAARAGDAAAGRVRDDLVAGLAQAVRILVQVTDVPDVVLTGGLVTATPEVTDAVVAHLRDRHADSAFERALAVHERVRRLPADFPAGAVGAALLATAPGGG
ncbi:MAG TPA: ROK family protein [Ornithinicoccus sp.]|nr:ROK family protein [Ornithinicoccus sp.]